MTTRQAGRPLLQAVDGGEVVLQASVAKLVGRAPLAEDPAAVGIVKEGHQLPGQPATKCQPCPRDGKPTPTRTDKEEPEREPTYQPAHQPERDPNHRASRESDHQPAHQPAYQPDDQPGSHDPGKYWMDAQGKFGLEGGLPLGNIWAIAAAARATGGGSGPWSQTTTAGTVGGDGQGFSYFQGHDGSSASTGG
jgi:hypothetical protein